jgi:hypothetical protein
LRIRLYIKLVLNIKSQSLHIFDVFACPQPKNWNKVERFGTGIAYNESRICDWTGHKCHEQQRLICTSAVAIRTTSEEQDTCRE